VKCPKCGTENPEGARFCNACGTELAAAGKEAVSAERTGEFRLVTILFADVVGSTDLGRQMGAEMVQGVLDRCLKRMSKAVDEYGGNVARLMGDGLLAFFGAPVGHEDDPERAALAALRMHQSIGEYAAEIRTPLQLRIGINTGRVVMGDVGGEELTEYTAMGDPINLAARLQSAANPGETLLGENTARLIRHRFELEGRDKLAVKGFADKVTAYALLTERSLPESERGISGLPSPLVGREGERTKLGELVQGLAAGRGAIAGILGEPGIGKTRLLQQAMEDSQGHDVRWAEGRAYSYAEDQPYGVILDLLNELLHLAPDDTPALLDLKLERGLVPLLGDSAGEVWPYLAVLLGAPVPSAASATVESLDASTLNQKIAGAVCRTIEAHAEKQPLCVVFDDLHWADLSSLNLIETLLMSSETAPLLLFLLFRPERDKPCWKLKVKAESDFPHRYVELTLAPLDGASSEEMIDSLLQVAALPSPVRDRICDISEGNPFFLEELIRDLIEEGQLVRGDDGWTIGGAEAHLHVPDTLEKVVQARLDRLKRDERLTLQVASVIGRQFAFKVLEEISQLHAELQECILGLQRADLVRERARIPELEYAFKNVLVQQVTYATLLQAQRAEFHRRTGETLERLFADRLEEFYPMLAYHFREAGDRRATGYAVLAGDAAMKLYANAEAIAHYTQALEGIDRETAPVDDVLHLYTSRGRAYELSGQFEEALSNYGEMEALSSQRKEQRLELAALMAMATVYATPTPVADPTRGMALSEKALAIARRMQDRPAEAKILWNLMLAHKFAGQAETGLPFGEQSLAIAREEGLKEQTAFTLNDLAIHGYAEVLRTQDAVRVLAEAQALWRELGNQPMLADNLGNTAVMRFSLGEFDQALQAASEGRQISEVIGNRWGQSYSRWIEGEIYAEKGDYALGIETMRACIRLGDQAGFMAASVGTRASLALRYTELGAFDKAIPICQTAVDRAIENLPFWKAWPLAVLSYAELGAGDLASAAAHVDEANRSSSDMNMFFVGYVVTLANAELAVAEDRQDQALEAVRGYMEVAHTRGQKVQLPDLLEVRARALIKQGKLDEAKDTLEQGLSLAEALDSRRLAWRIHLTLSRVEAQLGDEAAARHHLTQAKEIVDYISEHTGAADLRQSFLELPDVRAVMQA
jgi:class 3 adenylate cyclase/tetratricopeptide (TPR) repeat protein